MWWLKCLFISVGKIGSDGNSIADPGRTWSFYGVTIVSRALLIPVPLLSFIKGKVSIDLIDILTAVAVCAFLSGFAHLVPLTWNHIMPFQSETDPNIMFIVAIPRADAVGVRFYLPIRVYLV